MSCAGGVWSFRFSVFRSTCYACWLSAVDNSSRERKFWSASGARSVFVDSETSINTAVRKVRRALCDNPEAPRFVATVPARGYRFVAEIRGTKTSRAEQFRSRPPGAMVGRERELASLLSGLDDAASRRGRLFLISGEPGVGKTRLADEVAVVADAKRMTLLVGHCSEHDEAVAYLPFVEILENFVDRVSNPDHLRTALGDQAPELARLLPKLQSVLPSFRHRSICRQLRRGATCSIAFATSRHAWLRSSRRFSFSKISTGPTIRRCRCSIT